MLKKTIYLLAILAVHSGVKAQSYDSFYGSVVANSSADTILAYLTHFESLGVKELGTAAQTNTKNWILDKYDQYGYTDVTIDNYSYFGQNTANIIVKKQGCLYPDTYVIVDGHYDTKTGTGTNDNGSGTAIILEMARLLADVKTNYSILFIHFSGEEDGLKGSQHYVTNTVIPTNMDIKLVLNLDEVGGMSTMTNNTIVCERDEDMVPSGNNAASAIVTNQLATCVGLYSSLNTEISYAYASDYVPFENNGEIITGLYEKNESPYPHTANDFLVNMDPVYVYEVGKGATGAVMFFAEAYPNTQLIASACDSYVSPSGLNNWTATGVYYDTLQGIAGCDSIIEIDLTINTIDVSTNLVASTIAANNTTAQGYQWIDCDNGNQVITGETGMSYTPAVSGNYAVIITENGCSDTSLCTYVSVIGIEEIDNVYTKIYPNPSDGIINIVSNGTNFSLSVYNAIGQEVISKIRLSLKKETVDLSELSNGVYLLRLKDEQGNEVVKRIVIRK